MIWDYDSLWQKAKQYIDRAYEEDRESDLFAFWASLALEFIARATLAKVHPALLADPTDKNSLLFAFGYETTNKPKSISITTVYIRCMTIAPDFTQEMADACTTISERRNSELHSGELAFDGMPTSLWLAQFYKASAILLASQGKTLSDLLPGNEEVKAAQQMIDGLDTKYRNEADKLIGQARKSFEQLSPDEQSTRREIAQRQVGSML